MICLVWHWKGTTMENDLLVNEPSIWIWPVRIEEKNKSNQIIPNSSLMLIENYLNRLVFITFELLVFIRKNWSHINPMFLALL